jgi:Cu(I)/Ag(I) efflux system membrane fusion protein
MPTERKRSVVLGVILFAALIASFAFGRWSGSGDAEHASRAGAEASRHADHAEPAPEMWTCSMHPQIKLPKPGQCPICGMDLIPVHSDGRADSDGEMPNLRRLKMSATAAGLAAIETEPVRRAFVPKEVRMVGKVDYDETRVRTIAAWVPGRIDRLYVDYTGIEVKEGEHLVWLYSPELRTAQEELLQAKAASRELKRSDLGSLRGSAKATMEAAREKLRLLGLTPDQIREVERRGTPTDHVTIYAPIGGTVVHKGASQGMYVKTGMSIYEIADLSKVWVQLDAYESDMSWIRYGQEVQFTTEAYPGETFRGQIAFIDPILDPKTRTVKVRVNVDNQRGKLKPEMFVRAVVRARVAGSGKVMAPELSGKWIGPMHPEVVRDEPGPCPVCGMPLVKAEDLGYEVASDESAPLIIPASAPLITGERAVVYVKLPDMEEPTFEGREIVLGPRAGTHYIVRSGLAEGEEVVVKGNFKIDSSLQIQARPSMMSAEGVAGGGAHDHGGYEAAKAPAKEGAEAGSVAVSAEFREELGFLYQTYLGLQEALAKDDLTTAKDSYARVGNSVREVDMALVTGHAHMVWMDLSQRISNSVASGKDASDLAAARNVFASLSPEMIQLVKTFGTPVEMSLAQAFCPMARNGEGARWLQVGEEISNPYFGQQMLRCGEIEQRFGDTHGGHEH